MRRRDFITLAGGMAVWPLAARAQQSMPVIGYVTGNLNDSDAFLVGFRRGLAASGFVEGKNFRFEFREHRGRIDRLPILFRELVDQKVTVIPVGTTASLEAARGATLSIPIIFSVGTDPVENGFVANLSRPGGNLTGIFNLSSTTTGKRVEVLRELVPSLTKFAFLTNPREVRLSQAETNAAQTTADLLQLNLLIVNAAALDELEAAFATSISERAGGMVVGSNGIFFNSPRQIAALANRYGLPFISVAEGAVREGALASYGVDYEEAFRLAGTYAGRILEGEKPANMPVQQSTRTRFVINLKAAKALGIAVSAPLLGRADDVIE
jgi:putative ABC transport system substrate-binding protein